MYGLSPHQIAPRKYFHCWAGVLNTHMYINFAEKSDRIVSTLGISPRKLPPSLSTEPVLVPVFAAVRKHKGKSLPVCNLIILTDI